jgi:hypothetical protein
VCRLFSFMFQETLLSPLKTAPPVWGANTSANHSDL